MDGFCVLSAERNDFVTPLQWRQRTEGGIDNQDWRHPKCVGYKTRGEGMGSSSIRFLTHTCGNRLGDLLAIYYSTEPSKPHPHERRTPPTTERAQLEHTSPP